MLWLCHINTKGRTMTLTDTDRTILDTAGRSFPDNNHRDRHIREHLALKPAVYFLRLNALIDCVDALAYAPVTVNRLRRLRDTQRARREGLA